MTTTTVRWDKAEYDRFKELADFHGKKVSSFIREIVNERVQDELDYQEIVKLKQEGSIELVSREQVMREAGLL